MTLRYTEITPQVSMSAEALALLERAANPQDFNDAMLAVEIEDMEAAMVTGLKNHLDQAFLNDICCGTGLIS